MRVRNKNITRIRNTIKESAHKQGIKIKNILTVNQILVCFCCVFVDAFGTQIQKDLNQIETQILK